MFCHPFLLRNALLRQDLSSFIAKSFYTLNPGTPYLHNWHIDMIADYLQAVTQGQITRLVINIPPRYLKSICASVAWPAWLLGNDPSRRILVASYSQALSIKHSLDCRMLLEEKWYQDIFPALQLRDDQNEKGKFLTTKSGFRFATSVGGTVTGEGGNFLIVDDPHNPAHVTSDTMRKSTLDWFDQVFMSRLNDKKKGAVIVVMQRLHEEDLTGHLLKKNASGWQQLILPAIAEKRMTMGLKGNRMARRKNSLLHPEREGKKELEQVKRELGSYAFAAQYQQQPQPLEAGMIKPAWLLRYQAPPANPLRIIQSWDTAIKANKGNDPSVCTTWAETASGFYLLDVYCQQMEYPELKRTCQNLAKQHNPHAILIEDKASGQSLLQDMKRETKLPVIAIRPAQDKLTRLCAVLPLFESGRIFLPEQAAWLPDYEMELLRFPAISHDDQVDSTSQFLGWVNQAKRAEMQIRVI